MEEYKKTHPTGKKNTDPDMPKRPLSAYFLYANEHREEVKKSNPGSWYVVSMNRRYEGYADCFDSGRDVEGSFRGGQEGMNGERTLHVALHGEARTDEGGVRCGY